MKLTTRTIKVKGRSVFVVTKKERSLSTLTRASMVPLVLTLRSNDNA
jgi:hypothetical protein